MTTMSNDTRLRCKLGKFTTKRKEERKENVRQSAKRRKRQVAEPEGLCVEGRRVVELQQMAKNMWCATCVQPLSLRFIENEARIGLATILTIRCHNCLATFEVNTCKKDFHVESGRSKYDINVKAALGKNFVNKFTLPYYIIYFTILRDTPCL